MKGGSTVPNDQNASGRINSLMAELSQMTTESSDPSRGDLNQYSTETLVKLMNDEDQKVARAVRVATPRIAQAVDEISSRLAEGGRLFYVGAGTAGRIGVLDASECPPTFGTDPSLVLGLIAGGDDAIRNAIEGAEDDPDTAGITLSTHGLCKADVVVGISASGRTPYVVGALLHASAVGALTIAVSSNSPSTIGGIAEIPIEVVVGPEFVAGSTRLKSGTAQKMVLNMLSTLSMVRLGKTYEGVMVDLQASNEKLRARSLRTVSTVASVDTETAQRALHDAQGSTKLAILLAETGLPTEEARGLLARSRGFLGPAIAAAHHSAR